MAHPQGVLADRSLTIRERDLVADFDQAAPDLLQFCGLGWQEACHHFPESGRIIGTMSAVQARQPVAAFQRQSRYASHLSPLLAALRDAGVDPGPDPRVIGPLP